MNSDLLRRLEVFLQTPDRPSIGPEIRAGRDDITNLRRQLDEVFNDHQVGSSQQQLIRSLVYLWHDHLDESHSLSQEIHNAEGSYLHGMMHRREPDYWNAKYWFNRVGQLSIYPEIAERTGAMLKSMDHSELSRDLLPGGQWNPAVFVDACEEAREDREDTSILQQVQEIEFRSLLQNVSRGHQ